jgi:hypothetical protein
MRPSSSRLQRPKSFHYHVWRATPRQHRLAVPTRRARPPAERDHGRADVPRGRTSVHFLWLCFRNCTLDPLEGRDLASVDTSALAVEPVGDLAHVRLERGEELAHAG